MRSPEIHSFPGVTVLPGGFHKKRSSSNHSISQGMIKLQWGVEILDLDVDFDFLVTPEK